MREPERELDGCVGVAVPGWQRVGALYAASAGESWSFQFWFRDANPQTTSNFSDVVSVTLL